jgi:heat shock protein HtpX
MWEQIRSNKLRSMVLVVFMGALLVVLGYFIGLYLIDSPASGIALAGVVWVIMTLVGYFGGDGILLSAAGARKIKSEDNPRLFNVVEEMNIAAGLPAMPDVYIIDDPALNAFATGRDQQKTSVAVTSGLLQKLNRDELQGVIAHEMAHIKNQDVLLMSMTAVLLGTIVTLSYQFSRIMLYSGRGSSRRSSSSDSGGGSAGAVIALIGLVFVILAPLFAQFIYFAISRRREYLADASGALYTRYPEGLASALEKLGASTNQVRAANQTTAQMYTVNPFRKEGRAAADWTSTHPPISERVRILRAMGGASYGDYEKAYEINKRGEKVVPGSALALSAEIPIRQPSAVEEMATAAAFGAASNPDLTTRTRETQNLLWGMDNYKQVTCQCGALLRVPPNYRATTVRCPHCGIVNTIG